MKGARSGWVLWIVPAALLALGLTAGKAHGPYYWAVNFDPEYCYLVNAVNLLTFQAPAHTDHPGATLQELTAAVSLARWLAAGLAGEWEPLDRAVLRRPEAYLHTVNFVLQLLVFGLLYWAGRRIRAAAGSLWPALVFQASFLLYHQILLAQTRVSPEPLLVAAFAALAGFLAPAAARTEALETPAGLRNATLAGAVTGFGVVTKVTFAPMALLGLALGARRARRRFYLGLAGAAALLLIPIYGQLPRVARWLWDLLIHQGRYGAGETGLPAPGALAANLGRLCREEPFLFLLGAFFLAAALAAWRRPHLMRPSAAASPLYRLYAAALAGAGLSIVLTAKHYAPHYALPAMLLTALAGAIFAGLALRRRRESLAWSAAGVAFAVLFAAGLAYSAGRIPGWFEAMQQRRVAEARLESILAPYGRCTVAGIYRSSLPTFALHFGNTFASWRQTRVLSELYPGVVHYHKFLGHFQSFAYGNQDGRIARRIAAGECVLLVGERSSVERVRGFRWEPVGEAAGQLVVRLTGAP